MNIIIVVKPVSGSYSFGDILVNTNAGRFPLPYFPLLVESIFYLFLR